MSGSPTAPRVSTTLSSTPWSRRWQSLWGAAFVVGALTFTAKIAALAKDTLVAARFGSGAELDAFLLALVVPGFLVSVAAGTLPAALTPTYIAVREQAGVPAARALVREVFARAFRVLALLSVLAAGASMLYGALPGSHLSPLTTRYLPWLALALAPYTMLQGVCAAWSGLLAAERRYAASALAPIAQPIGMALAVWLGSRTLGPMTLVVGLVAGTLVQGALYAWSLRRLDLPRWTWSISRSPDAATREALARVRAQYVPAVASTVLMSATAVVDQTMATWLPPGSVSALGYGTKLSSVMMNVGALALSTTLLPHLSELVAREEWRALRRITRTMAMVIVGVTVPVTAILIFGSEEIVRLLFQRGAFTATETRTVALVQSAYLLQLPVHLLGILYVRLISALQANRLLTIGSAVNLTVNLVLNVVFMRWWGAAGIALSTAGVYTVSCVYLAIASHRRLANAEANAASLTLVSTSHLRTTTVPPVATTPDSEASCASAA